MTGIIQEMERVIQAVINDDSKAKAIVYALIKEFGGDRFYFPSNDYESRNREIRDLHQHGADKEQLAKRYGLSVKSIERICNS